MSVVEAFKAGNIIEETISHVKEWLKNPDLAEKVREDLQNKLRNLKRARDLKAKRLSSGLAWSDVLEAMKITCWENIAFCCSTKRECPYFFSVCDALGLEPWSFAEFKENTTKSMGWPW